MLQKTRIDDQDYVFYLNKSKLLPISLALFENDLVLLNNILDNEWRINFLEFWTIDKGPDSNRTGNKTFLRMPMITRRKLCENFFYVVAEMSNTLARSNSLPGYDPFQEPVIFRKNLNLLLFYKLKTFKYTIQPELLVLSLLWV